MEISFTKGNECPVFKPSPVSAGSQNNPYAKEANFGVADYGTLQHFPASERRLALEQPFSP